MPRRSVPQRGRTPQPSLPARRGPGRVYDLFYAFERAARDDGNRFESPEHRAELALAALLATNAALVVMG